jgi:tetratricopeptide (TPR) repeat protein
MNVNKIIPALIIISFILISTILSAEILTYDKAIQNLKGIKYYNKDSFQDSEKKFSDNAIRYPDDSRLHFNQGNAQYKNGKLEDAEHSYNLTLKNQDFHERSKALHNLGNVKFQQKDYKKAIGNYRDALIEDPQNMDARYNYELAARMLQRQQQEKQQQNKNDENKDQEKKEQQKDQQQDQQDDQQKQQEDKEQQQKQEQQDMKKDQKKEDAEKMLKALLQKEKEEMKKEKRKMNVDKVKRGKYW